METIILTLAGKIVGWLFFALVIIFCLCIVAAHAIHSVDYDEKQAMDEDKKIRDENS